VRTVTARTSLEVGTAGPTSAILPSHLDTGVDAEAVQCV